MPDGMMQDSVVFTSWKEIASYLGKGVRTVQRWEAEFGLPVQRPNAHAKGIVRATREELDQWIATRWSPRSGKLDLPDDPPEVRRFVATPPTKAAIETMEELRLRNRALLIGLQESLEQLRSTCQNLVVSAAVNTQRRRDGTIALVSSTAVTENQPLPRIVPRP